MGTLLVAYATNAGSTGKVAETSAEELGKDGTQVDVRRVEDVQDLSAYNAVIVGGPMILGWHRAAAGFVRKHQHVLSQRPVAYFFTAMSLTKLAGTHLGDVPVYQDPRLAKPPQDERKLSFKERFTRVAAYLEPVLKQTRVVPVNVAFFKGKLDYTKLNVFQALFVMLVFQAQPGDFRSWDAIRAWAANLRPSLNLPAL
jgi:menaquinone-dependent protoporphyrinogen IX oxidase